MALLGRQLKSKSKSGTTLPLVKVKLTSSGTTVGKLVELLLKMPRNGGADYRFPLFRFIVGPQNRLWGDNLRRQTFRSGHGCRYLDLGDIFLTALPHHTGVVT